MAANLPENILKKRVQLQLVSLESPSDLGGTRPPYDDGVSPMTALANNLWDTGLANTPIQDSKRRLSMDSGSSASTPSPKTDKMDSIASTNTTTTTTTPLSSITNIPKRILLHSCSGNGGVKPAGNSSASGHHHDNSVENREDVPLFMSPGKRRMGPSSSACSSPSRNAKRLLMGVCSPAKAGAAGSSSPRRLEKGTTSSPGKVPAANKKPAGGGFGKRTIFSVFDDDTDNSNSRDSGYSGSQSTTTTVATTTTTTANPTSGPDESLAKKRRLNDQVSMEDILRDCSPGKEDGIVPLKSSPDRTDGFDIDKLAAIHEESETDSPRFDLGSLLSNRIILPAHLDTSKTQLEASQPNNSDAETTVGRPANSTGRPPVVNRKQRPLFRRALSMMDNLSGGCGRGSVGSGGSAGGLNDMSSPLSRNSFKRPQPPRDGTGVPIVGVPPKRCKYNAVGGVLERSISAGSGNRETADAENVKPKFMRSLSENELSIMKSCQLKEEVDDILPDSSRLYALPSVPNASKHPSLRSISCETLAKLLNGDYSDVINSYRIIDARYAFEFEGGHIKGAENWQHGEDEQFLTAFMPSKALARPPVYDPQNAAKRDILIFHCEFSSQRGPDFYKKLREKDRTLNQHVYPALHYPECYLLHLGYKEFFSHFPELCTGRYTTMIDPNYEHDLRKMRAKSKSWSGGTITRTGRMSRLHL